jgi:hypothetical protein
MATLSLDQTLVAQSLIGDSDLSPTALTASPIVKQDVHGPL